MSYVRFMYTKKGLIIPHQELGVFVEDGVWDLAGGLHDRGVVLGLPRAAKARAAGFEAKELQAAGGGGLVLVELAEEAAGAEFGEGGREYGNAADGLFD